MFTTFVFVLLSFELIDFLDFLMKLTVGLVTAQYLSTVMLTVMKIEADRDMLDRGYRNLRQKPFKYQDQEEN